MYANSKSTDKLALLLDNLSKLFPPEKMNLASYFEINWSHDGAGDISAPGCAIGFDNSRQAEPVVSEEMYNELRDIARKYNIKVVLPSTSPEDETRV